MYVTLLGKQKVDFEKDGNHVEGVRLFFSYPRDGVDGAVCTSVYLSSRNRLFEDAMSLAVDTAVEFQYDVDPASGKSSLVGFSF